MANLLVLDIGSTLVIGCAEAPAAAIGRRLDLDLEARIRLHQGLMTEQLLHPADVCEFVTREFDTEPTITMSVVEDVWREQEDAASPIAGAERVLTELADRGVRMALISNIWQPYLTSVRRHFGDFFDEHIPPGLQLYSCLFGAAKPSPSLLEEVLREAQVAPGDATMVGDSYNEDIAPAAAMGLRTVWLLQRPEKEVGAIVRVLNGSASVPTHTIRSIADLTPGLAAGAGTDGSR